MEPTHRTSTTSTPNALSRRTVLAGAAWSMPVIAAAAMTPLAAASTTPEAQYGLALNFAGYSPWTWNDPVSGTQLYYTSSALYRLDLDSASIPIPAGTPVTVTYDIRLFSSVTLALPAGPVVMLDANTARATFFFDTAMLPATVDGAEPRYIGATATRSPAAIAGDSPFPADLSPIVLDCPRAWGPLSTDVTYP